MAELYMICQAPKKYWREFPHGTHNETVEEPGYFAYFDEFIRKVVIKAEGDMASNEKEPEKWVR
jgi:abhydrolase domain-containing protein 13